MTEPLAPPPKKNPQKPQRVITLPPATRSRAAVGLTAAAAQGRFVLQFCDACGTTQYPPRDACRRCLSTSLRWRDADPSGTILAVATVRTSPNLYFRDRAPWRTGTVRLNDGVSIVCHVHGDCTRGDQVQMINRLDRAGQGVLMALPVQETLNMADDPQLRELTADPKHRRVLITDARADNAPALAKAMADAGAASVFVGESEQWRSHPNRDILLEMDKVQVLPLDVTDIRSVQELAGELGGKIDILINNARFVRPGGVFERGDTAFAAQEMEVNYLGLMRLAQAFGPAMVSRGADGTNNAIAWVNILSVHALSNQPDYGTFSASNAAALSLTQAMRADMRAGGVRVMTVLTGPTEDDWHQAVPQPKVTPQAIAKSVANGLRNGLEEVLCGDVAQELAERWRTGPKVLERELTGWSQP